MKIRSTYRVNWHIDIEATSRIEACRLALEIMRDPKSTATVFDVEANGRTVTIDLCELNLEE